MGEEAAEELLVAKRKKKTEKEKRKEKTRAVFRRAVEARNLRLRRFQ